MEYLLPILSLFCLNWFYVTQYDYNWTLFYFYAMVFKFIFDFVWVITCILWQTIQLRKYCLANGDEMQIILTMKEYWHLFLIFLFAGGFYNTIDTYSRMIHFPINTRIFQRVYFVIVVFYC